MRTLSIFILNWPQMCSHQHYFIQHHDSNPLVSVTEDETKLFFLSSKKADRKPKMYGTTCGPRITIFIFVYANSRQRANNNARLFVDFQNVSRSNSTKLNNRLSLAIHPHSIQTNTEQIKQIRFKRKENTRNRNDRERDEKREREREWQLFAVESAIILDFCFFFFFKHQAGYW